MLIKDVEPAFKDPTSANGGLTLSDIIGFDDTCWQYNLWERWLPRKSGWRCPLKAAVLYETKQPLVIEQVDLDEPKNGEVLVKIGAAGICRSDRHFMHGDARINLPVVLGHEGAGTVETVSYTHLTLPTKA